MSYLAQMIEKAKQNPQTIVLPEGEDIRTVTAAAEILKQGIAKVILLGKEAELRALAGTLDISGATMIDPADSPDFENYADKNTIYLRGS